MSATKGELAEFSKTGIARVRELIKAHGEQGWDKAWEENVTPWDQRQDQKDDAIQPPLREVIESGEVPLPATGRALVPGCGRGYDAVYLARKGLEAWGIDIAPKAVAAAQSWLKNQPNPPSNLTFHTADFFTFPLPSGAFDVVYDYTFFVALPPTLREKWGARMGELVRPGGHLIALVWPIDGSRTDGPPYSVHVGVYEEALGEGWVKVVDREAESSLESHKGKERVAVFRREAGKAAEARF